jgi:hypothetical protein
MKKILISLTFLFLSSSYAETIKANYKVEFGIFGEIGIANAILTKDETSYTIDVELKATGLAKTLSGGRTEHHISKGHIENGLMVSDMYQVIKKYGSQTSNKVYTIDHKAKTVTKKYQHWDGDKQDADESKKLDFYSDDDLLTLYFNLNKKIPNREKSASYVFKAVGAEKQGGKAEIFIPKQSELSEYKNMVGESSDSWYARAIIHQKIFSSDKGELLLRIGNDGITQKAVLKDLILFGDVRATKM